LYKFFLKTIFLLCLQFPLLISEENTETIELLYKKISLLEEEISMLRYQLEENSNLLDGLQELQQQRYLDLDKRLFQLNNTLTKNKKMVDMPLNLQDSLEGDLELEKYKQALELFNRALYAEALELFIDQIISFPMGDYAADAYFWSGEIYLAQKMSDDAREKYLVILDKYSDHARVPDSLYKLGEISMFNGEISKASGYFEKLIQEYPEAAITQIAKETLNNLQEESNLID